VYLIISDLAGNSGKTSALVRLSMNGRMLLDALLKLRQVCCDPQLVKIEMAKKVEESAKLQLFLSTGRYLMKNIDF
jgi:SNF2 family DNA or RNA helicase